MIQTGDPLGMAQVGNLFGEGNLKMNFTKVCDIKDLSQFQWLMLAQTPMALNFLSPLLPLHGWTINTVFGRVLKGMDVVQAIEKLKTDKENDKPQQDVKILNVTVPKS